MFPSGRLLEYYKGSVPQKPGLSEEMLQWMKKEADRIGINEFGRCGGIVLDEMSIQVQRPYCPAKQHFQEPQFQKYSFSQISPSLPTSVFTKVF
jgi:hypothetical protein